ncbi:hypothetical protein L195_g010997 [Trifolium pratense]|uniref:14 kDa zinc-binding protein n=1 Tax=Trifolium pratense TaxID=57577 RepID=A0A2K3PG99_TRIPR|nr:hypothetical protein L195_g010997 [Trifolium pratense]
MGQKTSTGVGEKSIVPAFSRSSLSRRLMRRVLYRVAMLMEDRHVLAYKDIAPEAPPHIIIIPKARDGLNGLPKVFVK